MSSWKWIAIGIIAAMGLTASFVFAQGGRGGGGAGGGRMGGMTPERIAQMREQMMTQRLQSAGLSTSEQTAAKQAQKTKDEARTKLQEALEKLNTTAFKPEVTAKEAGDAMAAYKKAQAEYQSKMKAADEALSGKLSAVSKARCLAMGILDNGAGGMRMMGMGGTRGGMGRGPGGGMPGGPGPRPGGQ